MDPRADRDGDGRVDGAEAFQLADGFDHDGNPATLVELSADGVPTPAGRVLGAFREVFEVVNGFFHLSVTYAPDASSRIEDDRWQSPVETVLRGLGDCEDFAIAKGWTLRMLGFSEDQVDVALVRTRRGEMHAVALVKDGQGAPWVLDNLEWEALRLGGRGDLSPIALVSPARIQAMDAQWQPTGTPQPASSLTRFQRMLDEGRGLLGP